MNYKYKKGQIFGKRLNVPKDILNKIYNSELSFDEFIKYGLEDKIPVSCLSASDSKIVEKFGVEKSKLLDWELLNKQIYYNRVDFKSLLMSIDSFVEDINSSLYELVKNQIKPNDYSLLMKKKYPNRLFDMSQISEEDKMMESMMRFNNGDLGLETMIGNWELFKDKDLSYCLANDKRNTTGITDSDLKQFMIDYGGLAQLIFDNTNGYTFINEITNLASNDDKKEHVKKFTDTILSNIQRVNGEIIQTIHLTNEDYKEIFKYSSMEDYLQKFNKYKISTVIEELRNLPQDYVFNMSIPFSELLNSDVMDFISTYGLKNIVDFDNECGHFFTKNNCEMLKLMENMYLHYAASSQDPNKTFFTKKQYDNNGNYVDRPYTKDEFYEAMRRMVIYGPTNYNYVDKAPDYRDMTGEFRKRNAELFISEQAPEELQKLFYTKSITPQILAKHPEFIQYLYGKDLSSCFKRRDIHIQDNDSLYSWENFYNFISSKTDFNDAMNFITEYSGIFDIVFDKSASNGYPYEINFSSEDNINQIQKKFNESFKKLIIEKRMGYPKIIPQSLKKDYSSLFLSNDAPKELQEAFYNRTINSEFILSNLDYRNYLKDINLDVIYQYMPVRVTKENSGYEYVNLISAIKQTFGAKDSFEVMLLYGKYIESVFETNKLQNFRYNPNFSKDELLDELDANILQAIIAGKIRFDENIPSHFKNNNPNMFLSKNVPEDIKNKFYNREFTLDDFKKNPELLEIFGSTNIACGFSQDLSWIIPLFNNSDNLKTANLNRLKVITEYSKIQDLTVQDAFKQYIVEFGNDIEIEKIEYVSEVLSRLSVSNSSEMFNFRREIGLQILKSDNPLESLTKIEDMFLRNNIPTVGKIYSCFEILHPDFSGFNFEQSMISPLLKNSSTFWKKNIVFSDLIKASFGSNNRSLNSYLKNIEIGSKLYEGIKNGDIQYDALSEIEQNELCTFNEHLVTLYNNTMKGKKDSETFIPTGDVLNDILELSKKMSPNGTLDYNLADRVIGMFCGFAGINTLDQAKEYIYTKIKTAESRNMEAAANEMVLEQGDFVKGIGDLTYLKNILQNGSVSKEYLGASAGSDATPLDTDISMVMSFDGTIRDKIESTVANGYGPIWLVLKNDDRFVTTRTSEEIFDIRRDETKMEVFYTGALGKGHYGIRTGFASSDINYIVMENYDSRVGLEIAMNGFYIPVANKEGRIIFTPDDYKKLREKMNGLSYYGVSNYVLDESLHRQSSEISSILENFESNKEETKLKGDLIREKLRLALEEFDLTLKDRIDLNLDSVTLFNTGSTGRGTNIPGDGDFDYTMQIDRNLFSSSLQLRKFSEHLVNAFGIENPEKYIIGGDIRELKTTVVDSQGKEQPVEIDITFTPKTDKTEYASDVCVTDRLNSIGSEEDKKLIMANIILAKQFLKSIDAYKPSRKFPEQGGLGGIGVENWILQNGGTLYSAAKSFVEVANQCSSFEEFKSKYSLPNFGYNHMADKKGFYPHDNYVENMNGTGYNKMKNALNIYVSKYEANIDSPVLETIYEVQNNSIGELENLSQSQPTK